MAASHRRGHHSKFRLLNDENLLAGEKTGLPRGYSTTIEPFMFGWNSQKYSYVPAVSNA
jgi:hypothetical protein